jgi:hypothetical protein
MCHCGRAAGIFIMTSMARRRAAFRHLDANRFLNPQLSRSTDSRTCQI